MLLCGNLCRRRAWPSVLFCVQESHHFQTVGLILQPIAHLYQRVIVAVAKARAQRLFLALARRGLLQVVLPALRDNCVKLHRQAQRNQSLPLAPVEPDGLGGNAVIKQQGGIVADTNSRHQAARGRAQTHRIIDLDNFTDKFMRRNVRPVLAPHPVQIEFYPYALALGTLLGRQGPFNFYWRKVLCATSWTNHAILRRDIWSPPVLSRTKLGAYDSRGSSAPPARPVNLEPTARGNLPAGGV